MATKNKELYNHLTPVELRAINDLLCLLNMNFLHIDPESDSEVRGVNFMNYFSELDFSQMSNLTSIESLSAIRKLNPEIKRFILVKVLNASHDMLFWETEREIISYLLNFKFIGAKEMMMLNCSYILRNLLPHDNCKCEFASSNGSFDYEMWITNDQDFHCNIYINTGSDSRGDFVNIFIDYHTILRNMQRHLPPFSYAIKDKLYLISKAIDKNNCFESSRKYFFSYKKDSPNIDDKNHGFWFQFYDIHFQ